MSANAEYFLDKITRLDDTTTYRFGNSSKVYVQGSRPKRAGSQTLRFVCMTLPVFIPILLRRLTCVLVSPRFAQPGLTSVVTPKCCPV